MEHPRLSRVGTALALGLVAATAGAQRGTPSLDWGGHTLRVDHGKPRLGRHTLDDLAPGMRWRLGSNEASTLEVGVPMLAGDAMVAPGHYRVQLHRAEDGKRYFLQLDYAGWALGAKREAVYLPGALGDGEPADRLEVAFEARDAAPATAPKNGAGATAADEKPAPSSARFALVARYGAHRLDVPFTLFRAVPYDEKLRGWRLRGYALPAEVLTRRLAAERPTVVATLEPARRVRGRKKPPFFNVVLAGAEARLVPALRAPVDSFGFGELEPFAVGWTTSAAVEWTDKQTRTPDFALTEASIERRRELALTFVVGQKIGQVTVPLPRDPG